MSTLIHLLIKAVSVIIGEVYFKLSFLVENKYGIIGCDERILLVQDTF